MAKRKCKVCGTVFEKQRPLQFVCSPACGIEYRRAQFLKAAIKAEREDERKEWAKMVAMRRKLETIPELTKKAQAAFKRQFFYDDGSLKPVSEWTEEMAAAVGSFDAVESGGEGVPVVLKRLRFLDGKAALDSMARHLGMFKDKVEVSVDESLAERLERARSRLNDG